MPANDLTTRLRPFLDPVAGGADAALSLAACQAAAGVGHAGGPDASWYVNSRQRDWWGPISARGWPRGAGLMRCPTPGRPPRWVAGVAVRGHWQGTARLWTSCGDIYVGGLVAGRRSGFGRIYAAGSDTPRLEGTFVADRLHGQVLTRDDIDGGITLGQYENGALHGAATRAWGDGWSVVVRFDRGLPRSPAWIQRPDGTRYRGAVTDFARPLAASRLRAPAMPPIALPAGPWPVPARRRSAAPDDRPVLSIVGLDRAELLAALFNHALPQPPEPDIARALVAQARMRAGCDTAAQTDAAVLAMVLASDMTVASAQRQIDQQDRLDFEYINGRVLHVDLSGDEVDFWAHNCCNTPDFESLPSLLRLHQEILNGRSLAHRVVAGLRAAGRRGRRVSEPARHSRGRTA